MSELKKRTADATSDGSPISLLMSDSSLSTDAHVPSTPAAPRWALGHWPSHFRLWLIAAIGLATDLWTKHWAFETLAPHDSRTLIKHLCSLQLSLNPGALFGFGAGFAPIFVGASVLALLFVLYLFANTTSNRWSMHVALGLVLAGALGNLYDRATQEAFVAYLPNKGRVIGVLDGQSDRGVTISDFPSGRNPQFYPGPVDQTKSGRQPVVRDFVRIEAQVGGFSLWPWVFNVADALLVAGVGVLLINFWRDHKTAPTNDRESAPTEP
jgi:lipoprotein signal peptidase